MATPMFVIRGEAAPTVVGTATIVTLIVAAVLWWRHGFAVVAPETGWPAKLFAAVLSAGLLFAATGLLLAIGAAIATFGALGYGASLAGRGRRAVRGQGVALVATSIAVIAAATPGELITGQGFATTGVVLPIGMGVSTAMLAATPGTVRPRLGDA